MQFQSTLKVVHTTFCTLFKIIQQQQFEFVTFLVTWCSVVPVTCTGKEWLFSSIYLLVFQRTNKVQFCNDVTYSKNATKSCKLKKACKCNQRLKKTTFYLYCKYVMRTDVAQIQSRSVAPSKGNYENKSSPLRANFIYPHKVGNGWVDFVYSSPMWANAVIYSKISLF